MTILRRVAAFSPLALLSSFAHAEIVEKAKENLQQVDDQSFQIGTLVVMIVVLVALVNVFIFLCRKL